MDPNALKEVYAIPHGSLTFASATQQCRIAGKSTLSIPGSLRWLPLVDRSRWLSVLQYPAAAAATAIAKRD